MRGLLKGLGIAAFAALSGTVAYLYVTDNDVKVKVDRAVQGVADVAQEVKNKVMNLKGRQATSEYDEVMRNQAWVDEQWEALGI